MDELPEELQQNIISFLDVAPPSLSSNVQEPHLKNLYSDLHPLKDLSLVSRKYHRLVDPILYQYLRVDVDHIPSDPKPVWPTSLDLANQGEAPRPYQLREWTDPATGERLFARLFRADRDTVYLRKDDGVERSMHVRQLSSADQHYIDMLYDHVMTNDLGIGSLSLDNVDTDHPYASKRVDFLTFLARKRRMHRSSAKSLVVFDSGPPGPGIDTSHDETPSWQRSRIWDVLRPYINPVRLVVMGSPANIAGLLSCYSDTSDEWAFHIPYQRIELKQREEDMHLHSPRHQRERNYLDEARFTKSSVLFMRYWDSMRYDEGSSLNAYGTYHYFEKRPPSIMNRSSLKILGLRSWLRRFTYTAVFPHFVHFSSVLDTLSEFRALATLTVQLSPDMKSKLLDDQERIGRGNMRLQDCWSELEQCYHGIANRVLDVDESPLVMLERFEPMDYKNQFLVDLLDGVLDGLGPQWVKRDDHGWDKVPLLALPAPSDGSEPQTAH